MTSVFISYKSEDLDFAEQLYRKLHARGHKPWLDVFNIPPGTSKTSKGWDDHVHEGMKVSQVVLGVITPESLKSENVLDEWGWALSNQRRLILLWLKDVPEDLIPPRYIRIQRLDEGTTDATINRELAALKRMYNLGIAGEKIFRKPHISLLRENNVRKGFFERAEFVALRRALPEHLKPLVTFAYYTGWRKGEILPLKWNQVDLANRSVRLDPGTTKSGAGRTVFLEGELLEVMNEQWERRKLSNSPAQGLSVLCPFVFHRNGKPIRDFRGSWDKACKDAGLGGRLFHDLRRTAVRNMVRAGVPERVAMMISGHKTRSVFDRYNIVSEGDLKEAAQQVWSHAQAKSDDSTVVSMESAR